MILSRSLTVLLLWLGTAAAQAAQPDAVAAARALMGEGAAAFRAGDVVAATRAWSRTIEMCRVAGAPALEAEALARRGEAYRVEGQYREAATDMRAALAQAETVGDPVLIAASSGALGNLAFLQRRTAVAEPLLLRAGDLAATANDPGLVAASGNDLGNLYATTSRPAQAARSYAAARAAAERAAEPALAATIETNAARLDMQAGSVAAAEDGLARAVARLMRLPPQYDVGLALVSAGSVPFEAAGPPSSRNAETARAAFQAAAAIGARLGRPALESMALGGQGELAERAGQPAEAGELTRAARLKAQSAQAGDLSFRWDWQQARLDHAQGRETAAIAGYRRALAELGAVRQDIPVAYQDGQSSFRTTFGPLYLQFVDLLLRQSARGGQAAPGLIREVRDALEGLKESELQDYFRDGCVTSFEAKRRSIETVAADTAVVYPVILPDRLELLVSVGNEIRQFTVAVSGTRLRAEVEALRLALEDRSTNAYLGPARQVHDRLIAPLRPLLAARGVRTLVIVPDGVLRTVPLAALHDGQTFLVERYALATVPGLKLVDPQPLSPTARDTLVAGLSGARPGFAALPNVAAELAAVRSIRSGTTLLDAAFLRPRFARELETSSYSVVHIASHGAFGADPSRSFVLAFDSAITMDDLETDIKFGQYRDRALELLTLSACQTAAGDDRAALGLAGLALKSGARSALATLWFISDQASSELVVDFYRALARPGTSKAAALQSAQRAMLADPLLGHPAYWAPFLLIGNWL